MVAGLNIKVTIWRMTMDADDVVGGAQVTGSAAYIDLAARITPRRPSTLLLQQGLETEKIYDMVVQGHSPSAITLYERDEIEITWPLDHLHYADRFRILGVEPTGRRQRYGPLQCTLSRVERSRSQQ